MTKLERLQQRLLGTGDEYRKAFSEEDLVHRIAERILLLRKSREMSQEELAERLGTKQPAIARLEGGYGNPTARRIANIAYALDCRPEDLVSRRPPRALLSSSGWQRSSQMDHPEDISVIEVDLDSAARAGSTAFFGELEGAS